RVAGRRVGLGEADMARRGCHARAIVRAPASERKYTRAVNPYQLAIGQTVSFLTDVLRGRKRVLEVGCGRGEGARPLTAAGHAVTAIDRELSDLSPSPGTTFIECDFLEFAAAPFDAVVFTASLHHIWPLEAAVERAVWLLAPGGLVVADDF